MSRRIHILGQTPVGDLVVGECDGVAAHVLRQVKSGEALQSARLARLDEDEQGHPILHEIDVADGGPIMVNSEAFRAGWDRTFKEESNL